MVTDLIFSDMIVRFIMYKLYQWLHGDPARGVLAVYSQGGVFKCEGGVNTPPLGGCR